MTLTPTHASLAAALTLALVLVPIRSDAAGLDIFVDVEGLRSDRGQVRAALYATADAWPVEGREIAACHTPIQHRRARCVLEDVTPGTYAIAMLHDEDDDGHMDRDFFGFPQEGYGFSNDAAPSLGPPSFNAARFTHPHEDTIVRIRARYGI